MDWIKNNENGWIYTEDELIHLKYFSVWQYKHERMKTDELIDLLFHRLNSTV